MNKEDKDAMHIMCVLFKAARAQYCKGHYKKALETYQELIDSGYRNIEAFCGKSICYRMLGDNEAAEAAAKEALGINPDYFRALQLLATIYTSQDKDDLTYEYVSRALSNVPRSTAEMSPRMANFARKMARYTYSGDPEDHVQEMLGLEEEDRVWLSWAKEFKKEYESKNKKAQNNRLHTDAE